MRGAVGPGERRRRAGVERSGAHRPLGRGDDRQRAFRDTHGGLGLWLEAKGLPPGEIGMHIHDVGRCDGPDFASAGPHWNPQAKQHGRRNPAGPHAGDLGNLIVDPDGSVKLHHAPDPAGHAPSALDANGAALVIHAQRDDEMTDPSGNSGSRIACAVLATGSGERG